MSGSSRESGRVPGAGAGAQPPKRPRELEDALNFHLYHPLAWRLARLLSHTPLTPNMVSVAGAGCVVAAGLAYASPEIVRLGWPVPALIGMALHMSWHVVDGADGDLARITGRASPIGEMVDGLCDYGGHTVLYLILGWLLAGQVGAWGWALMLAAAISHMIQANHVETLRRSYQWWVYDKPWLRQTRSEADAATRDGAGGALVSLYMRVGAAMAGSTARIDAAVAEAEATGDPARRAAIREAARAEVAPLLPMLHVLGPNPRAIVLGLSMLAGSPLWYFAWQVVALNALLVVSIHRHNAAARAMAARLAR